MESRTVKAPQERFLLCVGRAVAPTSARRHELALPPAAPRDAELLAVLVPVPDQQFTARPDHPAGSVEDLPVILEGHQVLLFLIPGTVHIPGVGAEKGTESAGDGFPPPVRPEPAPCRRGLVLPQLPLLLRGNLLLTPSSFSCESLSPDAVAHPGQIAFLSLPTYLFSKAQFQTCLHLDWP